MNVFSPLSIVFLYCISLTLYAFCSVSVTVDALLLILVEIRSVDNDSFLFSVPPCFMQNIYVTSFLFIHCFRVLYCVANSFGISPMICTFCVGMSEVFFHIRFYKSCPRDSKAVKYGV